MHRSLRSGSRAAAACVVIAAARIAVTFVAFGATAGATFLEMFALGLALTVAAGATISRGLVLPAVMRPAGQAKCGSRAAPPVAARLLAPFAPCS